MGEIEVPMEHLHEQMEHEADHGKAGWISWVALSSAILAVLAAISALLAGHHVDEAMIARIKASNQWSYYQAKSIKSYLLGSKMDILRATGHKPSDEDDRKLKDYDKEKAEIEEKGHELEAESEEHFQHHGHLSRSVTLFQIAIAMGAIAALSKRKRFFLVSLAFGSAGTAFLLKSLVFG